MIRAGQSDPSASVPAPQKCNVRGPTNATPDPELPVTVDCTIIDPSVLTRLLNDPNSRPSLKQNCDPAQP